MEEVRLISTSMPADAEKCPAQKKEHAMATSIDQAQHDPIGAFVASDPMARDLHRVLAELIALHLQGRHARWNLVGRSFSDLHLRFDEIVHDARAAIDAVAERMLALCAVPNLRALTVATSGTLMPLPWHRLSAAEAVDLIANNLRTAVRTIHDVHDEVDAADPVTSQLLHTIVGQLERHARILSAGHRAA
jgi:starvation-inducible DNA-binding protein